MKGGDEMKPVVKRMFCVDVWDSEQGLMATFEHPYDTDSVTLTLGRAQVEKGRLYELVLREATMEED